MGYSTCTGRTAPSHPEYPRILHTKEVRSCDGCDSCSKCDGYRAKIMWCWVCCGMMRSCPNCVVKIADHIVSKGPPEKWPGSPAIDWSARPEIARGYRVAERIHAKAIKGGK